MSHKQSIKNNEVVTTKMAADILDLSVSSVQVLADKEMFTSWKTPGGHRRYDKNSLMLYKSKLQNQNIGNQIKDGRLICVKIISNETIVFNKILKEINSDEEIFDLSCWSSLSEAYLSFSRTIPDILIIGIKKPLREQIENIIALNDYIINSGKNISTICLSDSKNLEFSVRHSISKSIKIIEGVLTDKWLAIFLLGLITSIKLENLK